MNFKEIQASFLLRKNLPKIHSWEFIDRNKKPVKRIMIDWITNIKAVRELFKVCSGMELNFLETSFKSKPIGKLFFGNPSL